MGFCGSNIYSRQKYNISPSGKHQVYFPSFEKIGIKKGLKQKVIRDILQDSVGYIWLATGEGGLVKYDGYKFHTFNSIPGDSSSISDNNVTALLEDSHKRLWAGTYNHLNLFNPDKKNFSKITLPQTKSLNKIESMVNQIVEDKNGAIWVASETGIYKITVPGKLTYKNDITGQVKIQHFIRQTGKSKVKSNAIRTIYFDKTGNMWVGNDEGFGKCIIKSFNPSKNIYGKFEIKSYHSNIPLVEQSLHSAVLSIFEKNNSLWVQCEQCFIRVNTFNGKDSFKIFNYPDTKNIPPLPYSIANNFKRIRYITYHTRAGASFHGIKVFDFYDEKFYQVPLDSNNPESLWNYTISSFSQTRDGIIFIGTYWGGLFKDDPYSQFSNFNPAIKQVYINDETTLRFMHEDSNQNLWIATKKLYEFNRTTGKKLYTLKNDKYNVNSSLKNKLIEDDNGNLWICYEALHYLIKINPVTKKTEAVMLDKFEKANGLQKYFMNITTLFQDSSGYIWAGGIDGWRDPGNINSVLFRINAVNNSVKRYVISNWKGSVFQSRKYYVYKIAEENNYNLWLATGFGLVSFNPDKGVQKIFKNEPGNPKSLNYNIVETICKDPVFPQKYLWLGTSLGGLSRFDIKNKIFKSFTAADGLPGNKISSILSDKQGNLWAGTDNGICNIIIDKEKRLPVNYQNHLWFNSGIDNNFTNYYGDNASKTKNGELIFTSGRSALLFSPENIKTDSLPPPLVISDITINNKPVDFNDTNSPIKKAFYKLSEINLPYDENTITFFITALDYKSSSGNLYKFKMEGYDNNWIDNGADRAVHYTQLPPGDYTFRAMAANSGGVWNSKGISLKVIISPPWWKTTWAYLFYLAIIVFVLLLVRKSELHRRKLRYNLELEQIEKRKLYEVDRFKQRFFTNISHELRTPLTLINGPIRSLLNGEQGKVDDKARNLLLITQRNGNRLQRLIDQVLDLLKLDEGKISVNKKPVDIHSFFNEIKNNFAQAAESANIKWKVVDLIKTDKLFLIDEDKLEKIIYNLLNNAFKFTLADSIVELMADVSEDNEMEIKIRDEGGGITAGDLDKIFDRFYQSPTNNIAESTGSGIGLAFVKELTEVLGGKISVKSEAGKGSEFTVLLPIDFSDLTALNNLQQEPKFAMEDDPSKLILQNTHTILLVEDSADMREYVYGLLEDYKVLTAQDGAAALELLKSTKEKIDLVISDVMMPRMDGFTMLNKLKEDNKLSRIPVIMLTAKATLEDKLRALRIGVHDYIYKPFSSEELKARVLNLLYNFEQRDSYRESEIDLSGKENELSGYETEWLERIEEICRENVTNNTFSVSFLAGEIGASESKLQRQLKRLTGLTPKEYIREVKLQYARKLIESRKYNSLEHVSSVIGFSRSDYFSRLYYRRFGQFPYVN